MSLFRKRKRYGLAPSVARASRAMTGNEVRFLDFVMGAGFVVLSAWSVLFYISVCLPWASKLHTALSVTFLLIPLFFFQLNSFYHSVEAGRVQADQLGNLRWVVLRWLREFVGFVGEMFVVFSGVYLVLRLLMRFFSWPNILFTWIAARIDAFLGVSLADISNGNPNGWLAGWAYTVVAGYYVINFLYLWTGVLKVGSFAAAADTQFIDERILSPALYGVLARFLSGSFFLAVLLSVAGAIFTVVSGIGSLVGWRIPHLELDFITEVFGRADQALHLSLPDWWKVWHIPLAVTIIRVLFVRTVYVKQILSATWGMGFYTIGCVVLVLPLFFRTALGSLPVGHFYDGYLLVAQCVYAVAYVCFLIPFFGLMISERIKSEARR